MAKITRALVSVSDKTGLVDFVKGLRAFNVEVLSTGGTAKLLTDAGVPVVAVSDHTGSPEILDGRVKTLHPKIHGGILGRRGDRHHQEQMTAHGIAPIDMVVVNLYPFEATVARPDCRFEEAIENIDIGGPSMVRSAAKNHHDVTVLVDPADYGKVLDEMRGSGGAVSVETNTRLARKAFQMTAHYDGAIADYLGGFGGAGRQAFGETIHLGLQKAQDLRYGENPHQQAALYGDFFRAVEQLHGKELSYNNIVDINAALYLMLEFIDDRDAAVAILKHNTPCGVGTAARVLEAYRRAFTTDPDSPFGGIVVSNQTWSLDLAREVDEIFTEVLIAPDFAPDALEFLRKKKNRRLMRWHPDVMRSAQREVRGVFGGLLVQDADRAMEDPSAAKVVTKRQPTAEEYAGLAFGLKVVKHVKSNAIAFVEAHRTLALGGGATSRVDPVHAAREKAARVGVSLQGSVLASDAFFPFPDGVEEAAKAGASAIVQPGGSVRDDEVIAAADRLNLAMVFTGVRHFRH
ncbi:MAG TPA: bifunctional phosphoribosylaminoimidazolecarboxamide formyltransferase/IMP cyclohydrolase [Candidatus Margulisiibacteriota bacterium]|nr:bifunctional phosphoribosylaminoimidazolecarboxamide formyltransferase/IMP cyclohydrolase [Candidatus Margulisiibacteriota bacterium]